MSAPVRSHAPGCPCNLCMPCDCAACQAVAACMAAHGVSLRTPELTPEQRDATRWRLAVALAVMERVHPGKSYPDPAYTKGKAN